MHPTAHNVDSRKLGRRLSEIQGCEGVEHRSLTKVLPRAYHVYRSMSYPRRKP